MTGETGYDPRGGATRRTKRMQVPHLNNWIRGAQLLKRWKIAESETDQPQTRQSERWSMPWRKGGMLGNEKA